MGSKNGVLTGKGKALRVLPQKGKLDDEAIRDFISQAINIIASK